MSAIFKDPLTVEFEKEKKINVNDVDIFQELQQGISLY